jgi:hypothetical protein
MDPRDVGDLVVRSIRDRTFWILPNGHDHLASVKADYDELFATD